MVKNKLNICNLNVTIYGALSEKLSGTNVIIWLTADCDQ